MIIPRNAWSSFLVSGGSISMSAFSFCGSGFAPCWIWFHQKMALMYTWNGICLCLVSDLPSLQICSTLCNVSSWCFLLASYPTTKMSLAILNTFGNSLNILLIFLWNQSPAGDPPNGNLLYLYLPNCYVNIMRYDDISSSLRLW